MKTRAWLYLLPESLERPSTEWQALWWLGQEDPTRGALEDAAQAISGREITLMLPVEAVSYCRVEVPTRSGRWQRQAVRYAAEERLIDDVDVMHLAIGRSVAANKTCGLISIRQTWLESCLARLKTLDMLPRHIRVDADCLPYTRASALWLEGRWLIGGANFEVRMSMSEQDVEALGNLLPGDLDWYTGEEHQPPRLTDNAHWQTVSSTPRLLIDGATVSIDLCQEQFKQIGPRRMPWLPLGIMIGLGFLAQLGSDHGQSLLLEQRAGQLNKDSLVQYRQRYPHDSRIVDLSRQFEQQQSRAREAKGGLARQMYELAQYWDDSGGNVSIVKQLRFDKETGWALVVKTPDFADLERLREGLKQKGLDVRSDAAVRVEGEVNTRLFIKKSEVVGSSSASLEYQPKYNVTRHSANL